MRWGCGARAAHSPGRLRYNLLRCATGDTRLALRGEPEVVNHREAQPTLARLFGVASAVRLGSPPIRSVAGVGSQPIFN